MGVDCSIKALDIGDSKIHEVIINPASHSYFYIESYYLASYFRLKFAKDEK